MTINIIIGNIISLAAACFTAASTFLHKRRTVYLCQVWQCILLAVASIFFRSYAGITTLVLCAVRNVFIMKEKYTGKLCAVFFVLVGVAGLISNNRGFIGLIPVFATLLYTVGAYVAKKEITIKWNIMANLILWGIYEAAIMDYASLISDLVGVTAGIVSLCSNKMKNSKKSDL